MGKEDKGPPTSLIDWLRARGATEIVAENVYLPRPGGPRDTKQRTLITDGGHVERHYVLTAVNLKDLEFKSHKFNPRKPKDTKVNELKASVKQLSLLSPLTCAYIAKENRSPDEDEVVLIDGRHRYDAMRSIGRDEHGWFSDARVDLKIYHHLEKSDMHVLATYLNRIRRPLKKGEYYKAIVKMYQEKKDELEGRTGEPMTESQIFDSLAESELPSADFDLSVGRIVGVCALEEEEEGAWFPLVGNYQHDRFPKDGKNYYCPLTAGNLAEFLRYLCRPKAYEDFGEKRAVEFGNVIKLGTRFSEIILDEPVSIRGEVTHTTVACKYWPMVAFGGLVADCKDLPEKDSQRHMMAHQDLPWDAIDGLLKAYKSVMRDQAKVINKYLKSDALVDLKDAWSFQTQRDQVRRPLREQLNGSGFKFRGESEGAEKA